MGYLTNEALWIASSNAVLAHVASTANPHGVTAAQAGAVGTNDATYLNLTTNTATKAQGEKADTALQSHQTMQDMISEGRAVVSATNSYQRLFIDFDAVAGYAQKSGIRWRRVSDGEIFQYYLDASIVFATWTETGSGYDEGYTVFASINPTNGIVAPAATITGRMTAGSFSADRTPYTNAYSSTVTVSRANGDLQTFEIGPAMEIRWPVGDAGYDSAIFFAIPPVGTNAVSMATNQTFVAYYYGDSLTAGTAIGTNRYTRGIYETPAGTTNATVRLWKGANQ
jgi:hypothetical protein